MSDERKKIEVIDYLYGELEEGRVRALLREAESDPGLASDLRSLQGARALYQQAALPDPPPLLSEAILRQERILRAQPESFWAPLVRLFMHPAFGAAGIVVVAIGAGLVYTLSQPPVPRPQPAATAADEGTTSLRDGVEFAVEEARAVSDKDQDGDETPPAPTAAAQPSTGEKQIAAVSPESKADGAGAGGSAKLRRGSVAKKSTGPGAGYAGHAEQDMLEDSMAKARAGRAKEARPFAPAPPVDSILYPAGKAAAAEQTVPERKRAAAVSLEGKPGSAGQLTAPDALAQQEPAPVSQAIAGSAGNVASDDRSLRSLSSGRTADEENESSAREQAPIKLPKLAPKTESSGLAQELGAIKTARIAKRAQDALAAGRVAMDSRRYLEAYDQFKLAEKLDVGRKLAPEPQVMQAKALYEYKMWRDAAQILEQVLAGYPAFPARNNAHQLLIKCYQRLDDSTLASRAQKRYAAETAAKAKANAKTKSSKANSSIDTAPAEAADEAPAKAAPANAQ
ncbi:MAG: hypothetical protein JXR83_04670 [Deltaproteobacteria bacterium]|nr:hypothetical protein [Deltaproteobacteria bacterium]